MARVDLARGGQACALEDLFDRYYLRVYGMAYKWCGVREDAEDIAQDVFVKVARKLHTFSRQSSFKTWLYRIVINTAKDFDRKRSRKRDNEAAFVLEQRLHNPGGSDVDPLAAGRLLSAIDKLPAKQKAAILLVFGEGLSHKETAMALGCAETTVSWRIFQARKRLKKSLDREI